MIDQIRDSFAEGLTEYYKSGKMPDNISLDMRHNLKAHSKRLEKMGIKYNVFFKDAPNPLPGVTIKETNKFRSHMCRKHCNFIATFTDIGMTSVKRDVAEEDIFHCQIVERKETRADAGQPFTCPNCGHESTRDKFKDGCPMCGTAFLDHDLYPCVNSYHIIPRPLPNKKTFDGAMKATLFLSIFLGFLFGFTMAFAFGDSSGSFFVGLLAFFISWIVGIAISFVPVYVLMNFVVSLKATVGMLDMANNFRETKGAIGSKEKTEQAMMPYDKNFSFEVFEGKILSMLRTIAYSENRSECNMYIGKNDLSFMDNLIDIEYRGATQFLNCVSNEGVIHLVVRIYLDNIYYQAGEFRRVKENFLLDVIRDQNVETQVEFSPHAVNCPTCASTFDAVVMKHCPNCGNQYNLVSKEWTILDIKNEGYSEEVRI